MRGNGKEGERDRRRAERRGGWEDGIKRQKKRRAWKKKKKIGTEREAEQRQGEKGRQKDPDR